MSLAKGREQIGRAEPGILHRAARAVGRRFHAWRQRLALESALWRLEDSALDDIGITRDEISLYARVQPTAVRLLDSMLSGLGIDEERVRSRGLLWNELRKTCLHCPNKGACARWLRTGKPWDGYRAFCWNAATLDRLPRRTDAPEPAAEARADPVAALAEAFVLRAGEHGTMRT